MFRTRIVTTRSTRPWAPLAKAFPQISPDKVPSEHPVDAYPDQAYRRHTRSDLRKRVPSNEVETCLRLYFDI